jgi:hypothetical protein
MVAEIHYIYKNSAWSDTFSGSDTTLNKFLRDIILRGKTFAFGYLHEFVTEFENNLGCDAMVRIGLIHEKNQRSKILCCRFNISFFPKYFRPCQPEQYIISCTFVQYKYIRPVYILLKGQCHEIFYPGFFLQTTSPGLSRQA